MITCNIGRKITHKMRIDSKKGENILKARIRKSVKKVLQKKYYSGGSFFFETFGDNEKSCTFASLLKRKCTGV